MKICLDAGHHGKYNQSPCNNAYYESDMNWALHLLLKKYLEQQGIEVITTRGSQATDLALTSRGKKAKGCDLFISIHSNAVGSGVNESIDYPVAYVPLNGSCDKIGKLLADGVADVMGTKQKGQIQSKKGSTGMDYYGVIRGAVSVGVPGIILEHSFHTNTKMTNWLLNSANLDKMAKAEAEIIAAYFGVDKPDSTVYRIQVGAFVNRAYANELLAKVKQAGFDAFVTYTGGYYKVQVGAYKVKKNADAQLAAVKAAGFPAFITTA